MLCFLLQLSSRRSETSVRPWRGSCSRTTSIPHKKGTSSVLCLLNVCFSSSLIVLAICLCLLSEKVSIFYSFWNDLALSSSSLWLDQHRFIFDSEGLFAWRCHPFFSFLVHFSYFNLISRLILDIQNEEAHFKNGQSQSHSQNVTIVKVILSSCKRDSHKMMC